MSVYAWYVAAALAGLEGTATHNLSREGITGFSPTVTEENREIRLYPGYIFVELSCPEEAGIVNRVRGIHRMLPIHNTHPLALPKGFVDELRDRISGGDFAEARAQEEVYNFLPKEEVLVKTGPFQDHRGRFVRYHKGAGVVLLSLLGKEHGIRIPAQALAPIKPRVDRTRGAQVAAAA